MNRISLFVIALAALLALPLSRAGAGDHFRLTAESMEYLPGDVMVARGKVSIAGTNLIVTGDELVYHRATGQVVIKGNVVMREGEKGAFTGEELTLSLTTLTGGMRKGAIRVEGTNLTMTGERIERIGPDEFEVEDGAFSTCPPGACQDWRFSARRIRVEREGYLVAHGTAFYLAGIPVFYSPILVFPVKTGRQAGLLVPEFGWSSRNGVEAALPVFIPLGDSADLTFTLRTFSLSPDGAEAEVRYRGPRGGGGDWTGFALGGKEGADQWFARGSSAIEILPGTWSRLRGYGAGAPGTPGEFARTAEERDPGAVDSLAAVEAGIGSAVLWAERSRLLPDARRWSEERGLERRRTGASLGRLRLGPLGLAAEAEEVRFGREGDEGERKTASPSAVLDLPGLGPLRGDLAATWTGSLRDGDRERFSLVAFRECASAEREYPGGIRHRVDLGVAAFRASGAAFAGTARDAGDGSRPASLLYVEARSEVAGSAFTLRTRGGYWCEEESGESQSFAEASLSRGMLTLTGALNPDGDLAASLPRPPGIPFPDARGWSAGVKLEGDDGEVEVKREQMGGWDSLNGSFRLPLGRWEFSASAEYDLVEDRLLRSDAGVLLHGPCWQVQAGWLRKPEGISWRTSFSLTP